MRRVKQPWRWLKAKFFSLLLTEFFGLVNISPNYRHTVFILIVYTIIWIYCKVFIHNDVFLFKYFNVHVSANTMYIFSTTIKPFLARMLLKWMLQKQNKFSIKRQTREVTLIPIPLGNNKWENEWTSLAFGFTSDRLTKCSNKGVYKHVVKPPFMLIIVLYDIVTWNDATTPRPSLRVI